MATIDDVATNEQIQAIADGIRRVTRTTESMTIPEMPGRLLQIRVIEVAKLSVELAASVSLGKYDTNLSHLFIAVPETSADAQKLSDAEPELKLAYTSGELTMTCNAATGEEISILVADCLLPGDSDSYGFLISSGGAQAGAKSYDSTKAYKAGETFFYADKYQVTLVAHEAEEYTPEHNAILATAADLASVSQGLATHIEDRNNPHKVTAEQVGAYTKSEVDEKEANLSTAIGLKEDKSNKTTVVNAQSTDTQYPSAKAVHTITQELQGNIDLVISKADGNASNIAGLQSEVADKAEASDLLSHEQDTSNPHETTASQVGAYTQSETDALLQAKENASNKSQVLNERSTHTQYPTSKAVYDRFKSDEDILSQHGTQLAGLGTASTKNTGTTAGTIPLLDSQGKLPQTVIPSAFLVTTFVVDTLQQMTQLQASQGNICVVNDESKTFILQHEPASVLANWVELKSPTDAVSSVNGQTGVVVLASTDLDDATSLWAAINGKVAQSVYDLFAASVNSHINNTNNPHGVTKEQLSLGNVDNTSDLNKPVSAAQQLALDAKVDKEHKTGSDVYYKVLSDNNFADADKQNLDANTAARHTHSNKDVLDATTASYTTADKSKLDNIEPGAQANTVDSVNGKTGAVVLDHTDVGADEAGTAQTLVEAHKEDPNAHADLFQALDNAKVDKVEGKGLSTNDFSDSYKSQLEANTQARHSHANKSILDATEQSFTTALKTKLDSIANGAEVNIQSDWSQTNTEADDFIKNKPDIPDAVSDLNNDLDFRTGAQVEATAEAKAAAAVSTHDSSSTSHSDIRGELATTKTLAEEAKAIAQGRVRAISKDTLRVAVQYIAGLSVNQLGAGDTIFILETDVPDLWVYEADTTYVQYTWIDNNTFKDALAQYGYVQVGYYKLAMMESEKVDLSDYVKKTLKINGHALTEDINLDAADVGADASGTAASVVSTHNSANDAHSSLFSNKVSKEYKTGSSTVYKVLSDNNFSDTDKSNLDSNTLARHSHSNKALLDSYTQTEGNLSDAVSKRHSHSNKTVLDGITQAQLDKIGTNETSIQALQHAVLYDAQTLTNDQKAQVRANIGAGTSNFSGAYADLTGRPTIPTKTSDLTNDSGFLTQHQDISGKANLAGGNTFTGAQNIDTLNVSTFALFTNRPKVGTVNTNSNVALVGDNLSSFTADATHRLVTDTEKSTWNTVSSKANDSDVVHNTGVETIAGAKTFSSNMTLNGNLVVNGNITQSGTAYETHAEQVYVKQQVIWLRDGGSGQMTNYAGMISRLYDGVNNGGIIFDSNGVARVGDVAQDSSGNILKGDTQAIATRQDSPSSYGVPYWNSTNSRFDTDTPGTSGQILTSQGTSAKPVWKAPVKRSALLTLTTAGWSNNSQTVSVTIDTAKLNTIVPVVGTNAINWANFGVNATSESSTGVTFSCAITPTVALTFYIVSETMDT